MHPIASDHWLYRLSPREWIRAAMGELARAESAFATRDRRAGTAGCRRAAGMAINALLASSEVPEPRYGRSYMDHLAALADDTSAPDEVRAAARLLGHTPLPGGEIVILRTSSAETNLTEAVHTVMAHAYAFVLRSEPDETAGTTPGSEPPPRS